MICHGASNISNIQNECIRSLYSASIATLLVVWFLILATLPHPKWLRKLERPFTTFLTNEDAELIIEQSQNSKARRTGVSPKFQRSWWRTALIAGLSLAESFTWFTVTSYRLYDASHPRSSSPIADAAVPLVMAVTWLYPALRSLTRPTATPPFDLFTLFVVYWTSSSLETSILMYDGYVRGTRPRQVGVLATGAVLANWVAITGLLIAVLGMPLGIPSARAVEIQQNGGRVSGEDYTTLWGWITFGWVNDLIERGVKVEMEEQDVPDLSPSLQSKPVFERFKEFSHHATLFRQLIFANSLDLILDFTLTVVSILCNYSSPLFLKLILSEIEGVPDPRQRSKAYIYAVLMFVASMIKAEVDVLHLWHGQRASTRMRSELMAAIYVKALRRKDLSGVTSTSAGDDGGEKTELKDGADTGKIVQLMSSDANRISDTNSSLHTIYSAPMEIIIAAYMLYRLLGWSAFVGFSILIVASPINQALCKRGVIISNGISTARDKRMSVMNELIGGIRFIQFFAWESQWVQRAQDARQNELSWLVKQFFNWTGFGLLWSLAPVFVSIISFYAYIYMGNELTISTAFTAIALFNMIEMPLNVIPMYISTLLQAGVSLDRIATFLKEDEVPDYVSSFRRPVLTTAPSEEDQKIGITGGASFGWNEVRESETKGDDKAPAPDSAVPEVGVEGEYFEPQDEVEQGFNLLDIDVLFPVGKLSLIVGPTASGKSALLMALLGEMTLLESAHPSPVYLPKNPHQLDPQTQLHSCISYCAQTPWLEHATIKQNIIFYSPLEEDRYTAVIEACALRPDLDILEDGDETEIGSRGVSLSGGQKARVALARALYARTKHVILDDPLAAVDSQTARHLYDNVLTGPLMKGRTCILVTHHVDLVRPGAEYLVRMLDGRIDTKGTIKDLEAQGVLDIIVEDSTLEKEPEGVKTPSDDGDTVAEAVMDNKPFEEVHVRTDKESTAVGGQTKQTARKLVQDEERAKGKVGWKIYKSYLEAVGWFPWFWLALSILSWQAIEIGQKLWIKAWGEHYGVHGAHVTTSSRFLVQGAGFHLQSPPGIVHTDPLEHVFSIRSVVPGLPSAQEHPFFYVSVYAALGIAGGLISTLNSVVAYFGSYRASKSLFNRLLGAVIGSPMRFFDTTPTGRILNRFSTDIETVDSSVNNSLRATSGWVATFVASMLTVVTVLPQFLVPACVIAYAYYHLSVGYIVVGRSLKRMESTTRSPIFAAFGEMLDGVVTVRAFSKEKRLVDNTHEKVDLTTKMWYNYWMLNRWLLLRFDSLGALSTLLTATFALARLDAGLAGLTITSAMAFTSAVYWTCRMVTQLEMDLNSVERVVEYLDLPQEPPAIIESNRPPAYWPSASTTDLVTVEDLTIRYAPELPDVLHEVSFSLKPKERVGLLGRTGSGKSTLAMALLRFVDPTSGKIIIDGIDISTIGLQDLRSRVTIIPQDAVLFSGTIRETLDPFGEHSDEDCIDALSRVHINSSNPASRRASRPPSIHSNDDDAASSRTSTTQHDDQKHHVTLNSKVSAGGSNFSQGQRQLIAMARALLRRSTIIIMDEATSSIDFHTDALVQRTIREEFSNSLLITIAHRIRTIIDYDRLVVLDQGRVVEFDTPLNLVQKEGGVFRGMCLKSGHFEDLLAACSSKADA